MQRCKKSGEKAGDDLDRADRLSAAQNGSNSQFVEQVASATSARAESK